MKEALYYEKLTGGGVRCLLCPHFCNISEGHMGFCDARKNMEGVLYAMNYGKITSAHTDPIEKKPLNQFLPGTYTYSIGSFGCNLACPFCQNFSISKGNPLSRISRPGRSSTPLWSSLCPPSPILTANPACFMNLCWIPQGWPGKRA